MQSNAYTLNINDVVRGLVVAILTAVIGGVQQMLTAHGLDVTAWDWVFILNLALSSFAAYIAKNYVTDKDGKINTGFGKIG